MRENKLFWITTLNNPIEIKYVKVSIDEIQVKSNAWLGGRRDETFSNNCG